MGFEDYKVVLYRNQPDALEARCDPSWVVEIPSIPGCHALMPTAEQALTELAEVFRLIEEEYRESGKNMPVDTTEIIHA